MNMVGSFLPLAREEEVLPQAPSSSAWAAAFGSAPIPSNAGRFGGGSGFLPFLVGKEGVVEGPFQPMPRSMAAPYSSTGTAA